ncbi:MAG TPA: cyclic peptide export ABC transporter [Thermoanaerobaculia bacterium]|jgi:putative ATP-binding cassette transporter|nr:cyclic peptide export ABC transporter [Thermoanaerobaculia bacterium]
MKLFEAFSKKSPNKVFLSILLGAMAGISYAWLIPLVLSAVTADNGAMKAVFPQTVRVLGFEVSNPLFAVLFLCTCVFILTARSLSQVMLSRVSMEVTSELRISMYDRIAKAPIAALEKIGSAKLLAALTTDVPRVVMGARLLPDLLTSAITLVGMLGYLWYLNTDVFAFVMGAILVGATTYQVPMLIGRRYLKKGRLHIDELQESIRGLIYGAKELKLDSEKREAYFQEILLAAERSVLKADKTGHTIMRVAMNYGDLLSFFVIGAVSFVFVNHTAIGSRDLVGVIMGLMYVTGPIALLLNFVPQISVARVSLNAVNALFRQIPEEHLPERRPRVPEWDALRFEGVQYQYASNDEKGFTVGPVDFEIRKGEVTFIIGGNGSGKSTLSKLITQHYRPSCGEIRFGDEPVTPENLAVYRDGIAAIYSDYYLFDRVLAGTRLGDQLLQPRVEAYLKAFALDHKVVFKDRRFSTISLSDGQKRRLALIVSFIDDKQLYLFDECAADQDPGFKNVFYREVLPELKAQGKAVVVISHDDRYFDCADKVIVMEDGRIQRIEDRTVPAFDESEFEQLVFA